MINLENLTIQRGSRTIFSDFNSVIETGLVTIIKEKMDLENQHY